MDTIYLNLAPQHCKESEEEDVKNTTSHLDLNVDPVGLAPLNEGRPQPVVHIGVADVADHVGPPVDALQPPQNMTF